MFNNAQVVSKCDWTPYHGREVTGDVVLDHGAGKGGHGGGKSRRRARVGEIRDPEESAVVRFWQSFRSFLENCFQWFEGG